MSTYGSGARCLLVSVLADSEASSGCLPLQWLPITERPNRVFDEFPSFVRRCSEAKRIPRLFRVRQTTHLLQARQHAGGAFGQWRQVSAAFHAKRLTGPPAKSMLRFQQMHDQMGAAAWRREAKMLLIELMPVEALSQFPA